MTLFYKNAAAVLLVQLTLSFQCAGVAALIEWLRSTITRDVNRFGPIYSAGQVVKSTIGIIVLHGLAILLWASFYRSCCFRTWALAFYFSATSYATVGYGDGILPSQWRLLGPLKSMTGLLMCGISVSVLFALVTWLFDRDARSDQMKRTLTTSH